MQIIVDLDFLVYRAGFAAESRSYDVAIELPNGVIEEKLFSPISACPAHPDGCSAGDAMKAYIDTLPEGSTTISKELVIQPEPEAHALHIASEIVDNMITAVRKEHKIPKRIKPRMLLTGQRNYRYHIAKIRPYKGNRDALTRPMHYAAIREYLIEHHNAEVIEGHEADDEASIAMWAAQRNYHKAVLISQDKDLDQAPGFHFDPVKKVHYVVSSTDAELAFWVQVICGDTTDNIPGCYKVGRVKAEKLISEQLSIAIPRQNRDTLWQLCKNVYDESLDKYGPDRCGYDDAHVAALETAQLVYMQRKPYELWMPPGMDFESTKELEEKEYEQNR